ncbi:hypothetical protein PSTG_08540 [Puccinia striiformis f. sp. tritici PST-78]|uniref:Uncharacterized protein n=1 Tax=Puccinia striiformis f. sp. tritici PST-78 TaxID=1165861 RepID=A0A0L0VGC9_9BASI|nr:hypothetical protein PSTG_08540 [Puccinia striiformis f. sp. tritici PST-78]
MQWAKVACPVFSLWVKGTSRYIAPQCNQNSPQSKGSIQQHCVVVAVEQQWATKLQYRAMGISVSEGIMWPH